MANCSTCGKKVGFFSTSCPDCTKAAGDAAATEARVSAELAEAQRIEHLRDTKRLLHERLNRGQKVFLYFTVYIPIDSFIVNQPAAAPFDPQLIVQMGLNGWDLAATLPKTSGIGLTNQYAGQLLPVNSWGAGVGGNIVGAYLVFKKEISTVDELSADDELATIISANRLEKDALIHATQNV